MHTKADSMIRSTRSYYIQSHYSLLEPKLVNLRDVHLDILDALIAILDACLANLDHNRTNIDQERSISSLSSDSLKYSSILHSPLMYSTKYLL